jgi:hypothetical protein
MRQTKTEKETGNRKGDCRRGDRNQVYTARAREREREK